MKMKKFLDKTKVYTIGLLTIVSSNYTWAQSSIMECVPISSSNLTATNRGNEPSNQLDQPPALAHRVSPGDTLYGIARLTGIPVQALADINQLTPPYKLQEGQVLHLSTETHITKGDKNTGGSSQTDHYLVRVGDTLYAISRQTGINVKQLAKINQLREPYQLFEGQTLRLR